MAGLSLLRNAAFAGLLGGIIGSIVTAGVAALGYFSKDRELDIRMVEISLSILKGEATGDNTLDARRFALQALHQYSGVPIASDVLERWATNGKLPFEEIALRQGGIRLAPGAGLFADPYFYKTMQETIDSDKTAIDTMKLDEKPDFNVK